MRLAADDATGTVTSFIVGVSVVALSLAAATLSLSDVLHQKNRADGASDLTEKASGALAVLLASPGYPEDWETSSPTRLGLLKPGSEVTVASEKLKGLREQFGKYERIRAARALLGLEKQEMHLRTIPDVLRGDDDRILGLGVYRTAYLADYQGGAGYRGPSTDASAEIDRVDATGVGFTPSAAGFITSPDILPDTDLFADDDAASMSLLPLRLAGFLQDVREGETDGSHWRLIDTLASGVHTAADPPPDGRRWLLTPSRIEGGRLAYDGGHRDLLVFGPFDFRDYASAQVVKLGLVHNLRADGLSNGRVMVNCVESCAGLLPGWTTVSPLYVRVPEDGGSSWEESPVLLTAYRSSKVYLGLSWNTPGPEGGPGWRIAELSLGVDGREVWNNPLDFSRTLYDGLVVGVNADQAILSSEEVMHPLREWMRTGGDVIAMGSPRIDQRWLPPHLVENDPVFLRAGSLLSASDLTHPILNAPNELLFLEYIPQGLAYTAKPPMARALRAPAMVGTSPRAEEAPWAPTLSVLNGNLDDRGVVILTSYAGVPRLTRTDGEALRLMENLLTYARYSELYLDWGPEVPREHAVGTKSRQVLVDTGDPDAGTVDFVVQASVW